MRNVYRARTTGVILLILGIFCLALAVIVSVVTTSPWLALLLMGLPLSFTGLVAFLHGAAAIGSRIEIRNDGLVLSAPAWRGFPVPPIRRVRLSWNEVRLVNRRRELNRVFLMVSQVPAASSFPVTVYSIGTDRGCFLFGGRSIRHLDDAMTAIADRAQVKISDLGDVQTGLIRSLLKGPPPWDLEDRSLG